MLRSETASFGGSRWPPSSRNPKTETADDLNPTITDKYQPWPVSNSHTSNTQSSDLGRTNTYGNITTPNFTERRILTRVIESRPIPNDRISQLPPTPVSSALPTTS